MKKRVIFTVLIILLVLALVASPVLAQQPEPPKKGLLWEALASLQEHIETELASLAQQLSEGLEALQEQIDPDELQPPLSINDVTVIERNGPATFTESLSNPSALTCEEIYGPGFEEYNGHCYFKYYGPLVSRSYAADFAAANNCYLVSINDVNEQNYINTFRISKGDVGLWIGLQRESPTSNWLWDNGDPFCPIDPNCFWGFYGEEGDEQTQELFVSMETWDFDNFGWWASTGDGWEVLKPCFVVEGLKVSQAPEELIDNLVANVTSLDISEGIKNSLMSKLDVAKKITGDGNMQNDVAAVNALKAFINSVEAQHGKKITIGDAETLIAWAKDIIAALSGGT